MMEVGAYSLVRQIGKGAMGEVWRGRHLRHGFDVAVKFASFMNEARSRVALGREIEAVAALRHPGIVDIYDIGETPAKTADESVHLTPGMPWFAMQHAAGGALEDHELRSWTEVRYVTLQVLDALAHAHARGVIHRDLKPGNVLVVRDSFHGPVIALTDFGIAHVLIDRGGDALEASKTTQTNEQVGSAGTPLYMSPEQFRGDWRAFGPWTDIYALGCMMYAWITGEPPFRARSLMRLAYRHCHDAFPRLGPTQVGYPPGLDDWLATACAKNPADRFASAADAAHALLGLGEPEANDFAVKGVDKASPAAQDWSSTTLPLVEFELSYASEVEAGIRPATFDVPAIPRSWERVESSSGRTLAGIGLFGLRAVPFVDRNETRDSIWQALRRVEKDGEPRAIVVHGNAGTGKSRLVRWTSRRANEVAGIETVAAFHGPGANPSALPNMLFDACRGHDLDRDALAGRLTTLAPGIEPELTEALLDYLLDLQKRVAMSATARNIMLSQLLRTKATDRPVILWLDDVVWGNEALGLAEHLLQRARDVPVLVLMTVRSETMDQAPAVAERLRRLAELDNVESTTLDTLGKMDQHELVLRMLGLSEPLADSVVERSEGNPLFAVQLVGDLVQRDELVQGVSGIELRDDAQALPIDIHELWARRLGELVGSFSHEIDALQSLMVAAALGDRVESNEWWQVVDSIGLSHAEELVEAMVRRRLAARMETGWRFAHGLFREAVQAAGRNGRWAAANAACARWLSQRIDHGNQAHWSRARLGRFWVEAGELERGFECLFNATFQAIQSEEMFVAKQLVDECESLADQLGLSDDDERRGHLKIRLYLAERYIVPLEQTVECARKLVVEAASKGWKSVEAEARMLMGTRLSGMSRFDEALAHQRAARRLLEEVGDESRMLHALGQMAYTMWFTDARAQALELQHEVAMRREALGDVSAVASDMDKLGFMYLNRNPQKALYYYRRGAKLADQLGRRELQAHITDGMGGVATQLGDFDEAIGHFREATRLFDLVGSPAASMARFHEAHVRMIHLHQWAAGLEILAEVLPIFESFGVRMYVASGSAARALALVTQGESTSARDALEKMIEFWPAEPTPVRTTQFADFLTQLRSSDDAHVRSVSEAFIERHGIRHD